MWMPSFLSPFDRFFALFYRVNNLQQEVSWRAMNGDQFLVIQVQSAQSAEQRRTLFDQLVRRFHAMVFGYSCAILGDIQLAEDATQEAFLTAYQLLGQLREPQAFGGWLRRIAHTHCHRLLKEGKSSTQSLIPIAH